MSFNVTTLHNNLNDYLLPLWRRPYLLVNMKLFWGSTHSYTPIIVLTVSILVDWVWSWAWVWAWVWMWARNLFQTSICWTLPQIDWIATVRCHRSCCWGWLQRQGSTSPTAMACQIYWWEFRGQLQHCCSLDFARGSHFGDEPQPQGKIEFVISL